tara:strand:- start:1853 stop:2041 length:189 start_codon:yes stop_codon:yes gene_type:complete
MSEENTEVQPEETQNVPPKELDLNQSFNLLVNLARQAKLNYDEHMLVDKSVQKLAKELGVGS